MPFDRHLGIAKARRLAVPSIRTTSFSPTAGQCWPPYQPGQGLSGWHIARSARVPRSFVSVRNTEKDLGPHAHVEWHPLVTRVSCARSCSSLYLRSTTVAIPIRARCNIDRKVDGNEPTPTQRRSQQFVVLSTRGGFQPPKSIEIKYFQPGTVIVSPILIMEVWSLPSFDFA